MYIVSDIVTAYILYFHHNYCIAINTCCCNAFLKIGALLLIVTFCLAAVGFFYYCIYTVIYYCVVSHCIKDAIFCCNIINL